MANQSDADPARPRRPGLRVVFQPPDGFVGYYFVFITAALLLAINIIHDASHNAFLRGARANPRLNMLISLPLGMANKPVIQRRFTAVEAVKQIQRGPETPRPANRSKWIRTAILQPPLAFQCSGKLAMHFGDGNIANAANHVQLPGPKRGRHIKAAFEFRLDGIRRRENTPQ